MFQCLQTHVFQRPPVFSRPLIFATAFMSFFSVVIALFKVTISFPLKNGGNNLKWLSKVRFSYLV